MTNYDQGWRDIRRRSYVLRLEAWIVTAVVFCVVVLIMLFVRSVCKETIRGNGSDAVLPQHVAVLPGASGF